MSSLYEQIFGRKAPNEPSKSVNSNKTLIIKNSFEFTDEDQCPIFEMVNIEFFENGFVNYYIDPLSKRSNPTFGSLGIDMEIRIVNAPNSQFAGLIIDEEYFFLIPKNEVDKISSSDFEELGELEQSYFFTLPKKEMLLKTDHETDLYFKSLTPQIKEFFIEAFGFTGNLGNVQRLVLLDVYHIKYRGEIEYGNLEIFQNGLGFFSENSKNKSMGQEGETRQYELLPLASGEYSVLIIKSQNPGYPAGRDYYLLSNQESNKLKEITKMVKNLEKIDVRKPQPKAFDFYKGNPLEVSEESALEGMRILSPSVKNEFLRMAR